MSAVMSDANKVHPDPAPHALEEAAEWFACLADATADPTELESARHRWRAWLTARPDNALAWQRVESIARQFAPLAGRGGATRRVLEAPRTARRRVLGVLGLFALTGTGMLLASRMPWREWEHAYASNRAALRTATGETRALVLADGGRAWLGTASALDADYSAALRRLRLYTGDLLVETAPDTRQPARPFVVDTPHGRLRALGTRFAVRVEAALSRVDVFEGGVEIVPGGDRLATRVMNAGEHAVFDRSAVLKSGAAQPGREAWSRGLLIAEGTRLDELLAELTRWHPQPLVCDPAVADLRVVGVYPLNNADRVLAALQESLPVQVSRDGGGLRLVAREKSPARTSSAFVPPRRAE